MAPQNRFVKRYFAGTRLGPKPSPAATGALCKVGTGDWAYWSGEQVARLKGGETARVPRLTYSGSVFSETTGACAGACTGA